MAFTAGQKVRASQLNTAGTYAEYNQAAGQSVANITNVTAGFSTVNQSSLIVTRATSGAGHQFTLGRAGLWTINATIRFNGGTGERFVGINSNGAGVASWGAPSTGGPVTLSPSVTRYFALNDVVTVTLFQGSGGTLTTEANNGSGWGRINLSWIHD